MNYPLNIAVIFGGKSTEHDISVISAFHVLFNLDKTKYTIHSIYVDRNGKFTDSKTSRDRITKLMDQYSRKIFPNLNAGELINIKELLLFTVSKSGKNFMNDLINKKYDFVFPVFHGMNGEDGTIQGLLEFLDIPYAGCGISASTLCIDKELTKVVSQKNQIPITNYIAIKDFEWNEEKKKFIEMIQEKLELPLYIKPAKLGSSIGIVQIFSYEELVDSIENCFNFDNKILIENSVRSPREITVGVIGLDENVILSYFGEFNNFKEEFFDFEAKYGNDSKEGIIPAKLEADIYNQIELYSKQLFNIFELSGFARLDFFLCDDQIYLNEINTIPGLENHGTYMKIWKNKGFSPSSLLDMIIEFGLDKFKRKAKKNYSLELNDYILKEDIKK